jgi:hypothetical protein
MTVRHPAHVVVGQPVDLDEPAFLVVLIDRGAPQYEASVTEVRRLVAQPPSR